MFSFCGTDFGTTPVATYGFEKRTHAESLTSPTSIAIERFENFLLTISEDPLNHTAVLNEKDKLASLRQRLHTKIFRLRTSVTN